MNRIHIDGRRVLLNGMEIVYLERIPATIPANRVLVHNHVRPRGTVNDWGFHAWLQPKTDRLVLCDCGWATARHPNHYRVARGAA